MAVTLPPSLADFGVRSLITHAIMAVTFAGAMVSGLFVEGDVGLISFVAFVNFTAGLWICQSVHSLGEAASGSDYQGVLKEVLDYVG